MYHFAVQTCSLGLVLWQRKASQHAPICHGRWLYCVSGKDLAALLLPYSLKDKEKCISIVLTSEPPSSDQHDQLVNAKGTPMRPVTPAFVAESTFSWSLTWHRTSAPSTVSRCVHIRFLPIHKENLIITHVCSGNDIPMCCVDATAVLRNNWQICHGSLLDGQRGTGTWECNVCWHINGPEAVEPLS